MVGRKFTVFGEHEQVVLWIDLITIVNLLRGVVEEQLPVAEDPVAER